jgi:protein TonB
MFEDSLVESGGRLKSKSKKWMILTFLLEGIVLAILILVPLYFTQALPANAMDSILVAPAPPPPPPPPPPPEVKVVPQKMVSEMQDNTLRAPSKIPKDIKNVVESAAPTTGVAGMSGLGGIGGAGGVAGGIGGLAASQPVVKAAVRGPVRISSGVTKANCIACPQPFYPQIAKSAHIQGSVTLQATISKSGTIENLVVVSGPPLLRQAAIDGVRNWRYKPTILDGEAAEVITEIQINFTMNGG